MRTTAPALGYLGVHTDAVDEWRELAQDILGAEVVDTDDGIDLRFDRNDWRVRVCAGKGNDLDYVGWEFTDGPALRAGVAHLESMGHTVTKASADTLSRRGVRDMYAVNDPDGNVAELYHSPIRREPFTSRHQVDFVTGPGLGHLVMWCRNLNAMLDFYCDGMGLRVTDTIEMSTESIRFLRSNERHHSLALVPTARADHTIQHLMFEVSTVDEVGAAYERAHAADVAQTTIGRHSNDEMLSFYAMAPGGYTIEYGWGGRLIDEQEHRSAHYTVTSWWGHRDLKESR